MMSALAGETHIAVYVSAGGRLVDDRRGDGGPPSLVPAGNGDPSFGSTITERSPMSSPVLESMMMS